MDKKEVQKLTVLDLAIVLLDLLKSSSVLTDDGLLVDRRFLSRPKPGLVLTSRAPTTRGSGWSHNRLWHPPRLLLPLPRLSQSRLQLLVLPLEVRHRALPHGANPSQTIGLAPRLKDGLLVLLLEPADKGPARREGALGLRLGKGGDYAELHAAVVETDAVGVGVVLGDALLDDDLGGADVFHEEVVGLVPLFYLRNELLDLSDCSALLFLDGSDLGLDCFFDAEEWYVFGSGMTSDVVDEAEYDDSPEDDDNGPADGEKGGDNVIDGIEYVSHNGTGETENDARDGDNRREGAEVEVEEE